MNLLYIEDDIDTADELKLILKILKIDTLHAKNYSEALEIYKNNKFDFIISDIELPGKSGLEFLKEIRLVNKTIPIIITSAYSDTDYMLESIELGILRYLIKPITIDDLKNAVKKVSLVLNNNSITTFDNNFEYDSKNKYFLQNGKIIKIINQEILLIELLITNQDNIVPFQNIQYAIAKDQDVSIDSIRTLVKKLRQHTYKEIIESVSGIGYRLNIKKE